MSPETNPAHLLAELLKAARQQEPGRTQEVLSAALGKERSTVSKAEQGRLPAWEVLGEWLAECGITGISETAMRGIWRLAKNAEDPARAAVAPWYETEARAFALKYWNPLAIPGLFETKEYAHAIYRGAGRSHDLATEAAAARMRRQVILDSDDAPTVVVVLWQHVLKHQIGTAEVMRRQLAKLLEASERPNVVVQVLPASLGANKGLGGSLALASVTGQPDTLLTGSLLEDSVTTDAMQVRQATATFEVVRGDSANRAESRTMITEAMTEWETRSK
jgi:transcriptional regulator with XRE-family HTH domain